VLRVLMSIRKGKEILEARGSEPLDRR